jgi:hypothetical protein
MSVADWTDEQLGRWVYQLCLDFGTTPVTAHRVAAAFVEGVRSPLSPDAVMRSAEARESEAS